MSYATTKTEHRKPSIGDLQTDCKYVYISSATTTDICDGAGRLHRIIFGGGTAGDVTIYDEHSTDTTVVIGVIDAENLVVTNGNVTELGLDFKTGLRITTAQATQLIVVYT